MAKNQRALKILFISNGIFVFADRLLGQLYAIFMQKFDINVLSIGFSWSVLMLSATLVTIIMMKFGDSVKEKEDLLILGFTIRMISWILYIFVDSFALFIFIQVLLGIGEAIGSPAFDAIFAEHLDKGKQVREYAIWKIVINLSIAAASLIGSVIVYYLSFQALFAIMAFMAMISIIILLRQPKTLL